MTYVIIKSDVDSGGKPTMSLPSFPEVLGGEVSWPSIAWLCYGRALEFRELPEEDSRGAFSSKDSTLCGSGPQSLEVIA